MSNKHCRKDSAGLSLSENLNLKSIAHRKLTIKKPEGDLLLTRFVNIFHALIFIQMRTKVHGRTLETTLHVRMEERTFTIKLLVFYYLIYKTKVIACKFL